MEKVHIVLLSLQHASRHTFNFTDEDEDDASQGSNLKQKEKIAFLVNSMDTLKQAQKDLIRDNTDLHCEIPRVNVKLRLSAMIT